jgi:two-component system, sensor histidine kinase and response regulator
LAQKNTVDVAILDIRMAGMSGIEVLERLRFVQPDIEAIMMTAFETTDTMRQALRLRACDYINKPFDIATIRAAVDQAMQRRLLESEIHSSAEKVRELITELQNRSVEQQITKTHNDIYASILHDINGPLTVIYGFIQLLIKRLNSETGLEVEDLEFVLERLRLMERQAANCIEIQRRYLGFLRRREGDTASVGVNQLLRDLEQLLRVHPSLQENEFAIRPLAGDIGVKINGTDVIQILLNLTVNAFQCSPTPHRVELGGEVLAAPIDLTQFKDGPNDRLLNVEGMENVSPLVKLWVRDTGPGIPSEVLPKIFQPYFTTKGPRQGTGLGLNIVQRLVKEGHGALHCHTEAGKGTTFTVYLSGAGLTK